MKIDIDIDLGKLLTGFLLGLMCGFWSFFLFVVVAIGYEHQRLLNNRLEDKENKARVEQYEHVEELK